MSHFASLPFLLHHLHCCFLLRPETPPNILWNATPVEPWKENRRCWGFNEIWREYEQWTEKGFNDRYCGHLRQRHYGRVGEQSCHLVDNWARSLNQFYKMWYLFFTPFVFTLHIFCQQSIGVESELNVWMGEQWTGLICLKWPRPLHS